MVATRKVKQLLLLRDLRDPATDRLVVRLLAKGPGHDLELVVHTCGDRGENRGLNCFVLKPFLASLKPFRAFYVRRSMEHHLRLAAVEVQPLAGIDRGLHSLALALQSGHGLCNVLL